MVYKAALLKQAKQAKQGVVVLWVSGTAGQTAGASEDLPSKTSLHLVLKADITAGKDNRTLAGPLGVKAFPCIQVQHHCASKHH